MGTLTAGYTGTLAIGMSVTGTGIAAGTVVKDVSSDTITLSADSSGTASGTYTLSFFDSFAKDGHVTKYYSTSTCSSEVGGIWYRKTVCQESFAPNAAAVTGVSFKVSDLGDIVKYDHNGCGKVTVDGATGASGGTSITLVAGGFIGTPVNGMTVTGTNVGADSTITAYDASSGVVTVDVALTGDISSDADIVFEDRVTYSAASGYDGILAQADGTGTGLTQLVLTTRSAGTTVA